MWPPKHRHRIGWFRSYPCSRSPESVGFLLWLFLAPNYCPWWTAEPQTSLWSSKDEIDRSQRRYWKSISPGIQTCLLRLTTRIVQQLLQLPFLDQPVQMVSQILAILHSVSLVLMVLAIKVLVMPHGVSNHLVRPFEERLVLNLL